MHPRNPYRSPPDFSALARAYPTLQPYLLVKTDGTNTINFKDDAAQRLLTQALLHRDFNIVLSLPENRLCPPVPNRLNYILWMQDIVRASAVASAGQMDRLIQGADIGTGASAIYPLLGCKLEPKWKFIATDIDDLSAKSAQLNVTRNGLDDRINVVHTNPDGPILIPPSIDSATSLDFIMCNPPFYSSVEDVARSAESKELRPSAVCTGADVEMITVGGESAFVSRMVLESLECRTQCRWFTSMLGKMSSLFDVVSLLRKYSIDNYAITEFVQGQTRRWAIAWSFGDIRLPDNLARISNVALQSIMPSRSTFRHPFPQAISPQHVLEALESAVQSIDGASYRVIPMDEPECISPLLVSATRNTWSRSARRKNLSQVSNNSTCTLLQTNSPALKCSIGCTGEEHRDAQGALNLEISWVQGNDRAIFESFWNHICRKVAQNDHRKK